MRTAQRTTACVLACAMGLASGVVLATARRVLPVHFHLQAEHLAYAEKLGCRDPHGLELDRAIGLGWKKDDYDDMTVFGECVSHRSIAGNPVKFSIECDHQDGNWKCGPGEEVLFAKVNGKRAEIHTATSEVTLEETLGIVVFLESIDAWEPHIADVMSDDGSLYEYFKARGKEGDVVSLYVQGSVDQRVRVIRSSAGASYELAR